MSFIPTRPGSYPEQGMCSRGDDGNLGVWYRFYNRASMRVLARPFPPPWRAERGEGEGIWGREGAANLV